MSPSSRSPRYQIGWPRKGRPGRRWFRQWVRLLERREPEEKHSQIWDLVQFAWCVASEIGRSTGISKTRTS